VFRDVIPVGEGGTYRIQGLVPEPYQLFVNQGGKRLRGSTSFRLRNEGASTSYCRTRLGKRRACRPLFRQPFDLLGDVATILRNEKVAGIISDDLHQAKLPGQDSNLERQDQNLS
jgi:hypothetical protein